MESKTMAAVLKLGQRANDWMLPYQNLGPIPDEAMYQQGSTTFTVKRIFDKKGKPVEPARYMLCSSSKKNMALTVAQYRVWIDHAIRAGTTQIVELPWCRRQIHILMVPQDSDAFSGQMGGSVKTDPSQLPPGAVFKEHLELG